MHVICEKQIYFSSRDQQLPKNMILVIRKDEKGIRANF